jgi:ribosomal protein S18 acetylase RimI-like enzyme
VGAIRDATWDDFDVVFELLDARSRAAFGVSEQKPEFLRQRWELPGTEKWVAIADAHVAGYASVDEEQHLVLAAVEADVGNALFAHAEQRAQVRGFDHLAATAVPEDEPFWALLQRSGFSRDREVLRMWRALNGSLPEAAWPDGVNVRSYTGADGTNVRALLDEAYAGWDSDYVAQSHEGWLSFMTGHDEFDPELWFLVERDGELVACALHWKEHQGRGWVKDIVVRRSERGRGLGRALLRHGFAAYARRGAERVGLKVDSTNPTGALQLYEREGFVVDQRLGLWHKRL